MPTVPWPVPNERIIHYSDLNGDGTLEAICFIQYKNGSNIFILSEQDGVVYAYGMTNKNVKNIDECGVMYYCQPGDYKLDSSYVFYEGAFKVLFDKEECFFVNLPLENYKGNRCQLEDFGIVEEDTSMASWPDPY